MAIKSLNQSVEKMENPKVTIFHQNGIEYTGDILSGLENGLIGMVDDCGDVYVFPLTSVNTIVFFEG